MGSHKKTTIICNLLLLMAAVIWGTNFVFSKNAAEVIGPFSFMAMRYFLGATTIMPFMLFMEKRKPAEEKVQYSKSSFASLVKTAALMALAQMGSSVCGQWGLAYTTASKAAFLTATYVAIVPILAFILFRSKININMLIGVVLAIFGLYNLCFPEAAVFSINPGDILVIVSAAFGALHMLLISKLVQQINGMHLICAEFYIASLYCMAVALILEQPTWEQVMACGTEVLYASILGSGVCYMFQVIAQKYTDPTVAALLMSLESVFGALSGVIILGESLSFREILGSACIFGAVVLAQLRPKEKVVLKVTPKDEAEEN